MLFSIVRRKTMESAIERALKKEINSKFDVKIQNFYGVSLLGGNFGNVNVKSDNIFYNGFYFSSFNAQTVCPYNSVDVSNDSVVFRENMILKYCDFSTSLCSSQNDIGSASVNNIESWRNK